MLKRKPVPEMHVEVELPDLVLMLPLYPADLARLEALNETMSDGQHEVRELGQEYAARCNQPGLGQVDGCAAAAIEDVVRSLFAALDTVSNADLEAFARWYYAV